MFANDAPRHVVPRWRTATITSAAGELTPLSEGPRPPMSDKDFLGDKLAEWREQQTVAHAADVVGSAIVLGQDAAAREAAEFLVANATEVPSPTYRLALRVLGREVVSGDLHTAIRTLRRQLHEEPRSPLTWVDLARAYSIVGQATQATQAMRAALQLAPQHRFVLRSAARLQLHHRDPEHAHDMLRRNTATRHDPWLMAAEIAIAELVDRSSNLLKTARDLVEGRSFAPQHLAELASALATHELRAGNRKRARRLFQRALEAPTENVIAQAEWVARQQGPVEVDDRLLQTPRCFEARAFDHFWEGRWASSLEETWRWLEDEPFSILPVIHGSFVAAVMLEDYAGAEAIIARGCGANRQDPRLINNLVFALASGGQVPRAIKLHKQARPTPQDDDLYVTWLATSGLLQFRSGAHSEGRRLYLEAIERASGVARQHQRAMASLFLAREEILSRSGYGAAAFERARLLSAALQLPYLGVLSTRLEHLLRAQDVETP